MTATTYLSPEIHSRRFAERLNRPVGLSLLALVLAPLYLAEAWLAWEPFLRFWLQTVLIPVGVFLVWRSLQRGGKRLPAAGLGLLLVPALVFWLSPSGPSPRLLQLAIALGQCASVLFLLLTIVARLSPPRALLVSFSLGSTLLVAEGLITRLAPEGMAADDPRPVWKGHFAKPHPELFYQYIPRSVARSYYPDNPRGYFREEHHFGQMNPSSWSLHQHGGSKAEIQLLDEPPSALRVQQIERAGKESWQLQLEFSPIPFKSGKTYQFAFRARADRNRPISVGAGQGHEPWQSLGMYETIRLTPDWQTISLDFTPTADDKQGRLHIDLGDSDEPFELANLSLVSLDPSSLEDPASYFVEYRFNGLGFRDRERTLQRTPGARRILCLGDSFTMGVGVHFEDVFTNRLEKLLDTTSPQDRQTARYEVINCGRSGYSTYEQRLCYELEAAAFDAEVVLVFMVHNDDLTIEEDEKRRKEQAERRSRKLSRALTVLDRVQEDPDYSVCVKELLQLKTLCDQRKARLGVIIFRMTVQGREEKLYQTVTQGLAGHSIPILDLGEPLLRHSPSAKLTVHPIDGHPNEVAHELAAKEIHEFLKREGLLNSRSPAP